MGRIRTIKPEFPHSESIGRLSRDARLLFVELWTVCDDSGRTRAASRMLASLLFPYDDDAPGLIEDWLCELEDEDCIVRYSYDGDTYLQICNWNKHQKIDHPSTSKFPTPEESSLILASPREKLFRTKDQGPRTISLAQLPLSECVSAEIEEPAPQKITAREAEVIYDAYPRKVGKGRALRAIKKSLESIDDPTPVESLLKIVQAYARSPAGNNDRFTPHPATWFNDKRYLDNQKEWERT